MVRRFLKSSESVSRRGFVGGIVGVAGALIAGRKLGEATTLDFCYWKRIQGPICSGHQIYEYKCEYCCTGNVCEEVTCAWFITGTC
jgi:hypothetical protein